MIGWHLWGCFAGFTRKTPPQPPLTTRNPKDPHFFNSMAKIFVSYRRDDSRASVGRLYDTLVKYFDKNEIFMDVYTIQSGEDFVTAIERAVSSCDTLIAVIGPRWLEIRDEQGIRRLTKPSDYVRLEIAAALKRSIHVSSINQV